MQKEVKKQIGQVGYLEQLRRFERIKPGVARMERIMSLLGNPQNSFASIHISGTNGKGSTAAILSAIYSKAGYKTGLYTSPYLFSFNERIRINNNIIANDELDKLVGEVEILSERHNVKLSYFEFCTAMAFLYFTQQDVDIAVIEVGMGGKNDATNVIKPLVSIVTNIGLDHTKWLGSSKQEIAAEKAGIIKPDTPLVFGEEAKDISDLLKKKAKDKWADFWQIESKKDFKIIKSNRSKQVFEYEGEHYELSLLGKHQVKNAVLALKAVELAARKGFAVPWTTIKEALVNVSWPGRLQFISQQPYLLVDGAHNSHSMEALYDFITDPLTGPAGFDVLVAGVKKDKNISVLEEKIAPLFDCIIATQGSHDPLPANKLASSLSKYNVGEIKVIDDPIVAATTAYMMIKNKNGSVVATGSLYLIAPIIKTLKTLSLS